MLFSRLSGTEKKTERAIKTLRDFSSSSHKPTGASAVDTDTSASKAREVVSAMKNGNRRRSTDADN